MKRLLALALTVGMLWGCGKNREMDQALALRQSLLRGQGCSFSMEVTADYGEEVHRFLLDCKADSQGEITFCVAEPESICGITGQITGEGGRLTFDDTVLGFPLLAEGSLSPVSTPWVFLNSLRSGYMTACGTEEKGMRLTVNDSYAADALQLDIWIREDAVPYYGEILWQGRRILSFAVEDFAIL